MSLKDSKGFGCGVYPLILKDKKFTDACVWHDKAYLKESWHGKNMTRKEVDDYFLQLMLSKAETKMEKVRAYFYYSIARTLGFGWWK